MPCRRRIAHTLSKGRVELSSWPAPPGSADGPRSGSLLPDEGPERPCPLESPVVQAFGADRSISVAQFSMPAQQSLRLDKEASPASNRTAAGSIQRALPDPRVAGPDASPVGAGRQSRDGA
jgi:hypothetical protein